MIDMPPVSSPAHEHVITQKLLACGLRNGGFTVRYENDLQSVEIVIGKKAGASAEHFDCINKAADNEIVTFKDANLQQSYQDRVFDTLRPKMLADARVELDKRGVLDGFPERSKFVSDKLFAEALERQCGMSAGSFFIESEGGLIGQPKLDGQSKADENAMACLMAALMYVTAKGESFKFGFIGNEASAPEK